MPPGFSEQNVKVVTLHGGELDQYPRVIEVVVGDKVRHRIRLHSPCTFSLIDAYDKRLTILMQPGKELLGHLEGWGAIRSAFNRSGERQRYFPHGVEGDCW